MEVGLSLGTDNWTEVSVSELVLAKVDEKVVEEAEEWTKIVTLHNDPTVN